VAAQGSLPESKKRLRIPFFLAAWGVFLDGIGGASAHTRAPSLLPIPIADERPLRGQRGSLERKHSQTEPPAFRELQSHSLAPCARVRRVVRDDSVLLRKWKLHINRFVERRADREPPRSPPGSPARSDKSTNSDRETIARPSSALPMQKIRQRESRTGGDRVPALIRIAVRQQKHALETGVRWKRLGCACKHVLDTAARAALNSADRVFVRDGDRAFAALAVSQKSDTRPFAIASLPRARPARHTLIPRRRSLGHWTGAPVCAEPNSSLTRFRPSEAVALLLFVPCSARFFAVARRLRRSHRDSDSSGSSAPSPRCSPAGIPPPRRSPVCFPCALLSGGNVRRSAKNPLRGSGSIALMYVNR
jgi:hypothetical protein